MQLRQRPSGLSKMPMLGCNVLSTLGGAGSEYFVNNFFLKEFTDRGKKIIQRGITNDRVPELRFYPGRQVCLWQVSRVTGAPSFSDASLFLFFGGNSGSEGGRLLIHRLSHFKPLRLTESRSGGSLLEAGGGAGF